MLPHSCTRTATERAYRDLLPYWLAPCTLSPPLSAAEGGWAPKNVNQKLMPFSK
jgi:hypothetical protein